MTAPKKQRLVVKVGTNTLTGGEDHLARPAMLGIARQIARLVREGHEVALVSSGAIVAGRQALDVSGNGKGARIPFKQVLAAVGQAKLMQMWDELFSKEQMIVAQTLLTRGDLADRQGYLNARNTLLALLERQVIPIVNENDVVATEEIKIGDNDNLSALVANLIDADLLILLTDQMGLYTADPRRHASATLIAEVPTITDEIVALAAGAGTARGTGGMLTKLQAARLATESGVTVLVAGGKTDNILISAVKGDADRHEVSVEPDAYGEPETVDRGRPYRQGGSANRRRRRGRSGPRPLAAPRRGRKREGAFRPGRQREHRRARREGRGVRRGKLQRGRSRAHQGVPLAGDYADSWIQLRRRGDPSKQRGDALAMAGTRDQGLG